MKKQLTLILNYKDGTRTRLKMRLPEDSILHDDLLVIEQIEIIVMMPLSQMLLRFYILGGKLHLFMVKLPPEILKEIAILGLNSTDVLLEDFISNIGAKVDIPVVEDYNRIEKGEIPVDENQFDAQKWKQSLN